mmetsp:Transcript_10748/g.23683  ORF Transcript_10748/g.23683 Transcript_10748/m.23683 type:complete len:234 (+) Transcript_10748:907-1608(+)
MKLLNRLRVAANGLGELRLQLAFLVVGVPHHPLHGFQLPHGAVQLLAQAICQPLEIKLLSHDGGKRCSRTRRVLEEPAQYERGCHVLSRVKGAHQQSDEIAHGPGQGHEVEDLVLLVTKLESEFAGVRGVDDHLGIVCGVGRHHLTTSSAGSWVNHLHVLLGDMDLQVARMGIVLIPEVAHRKARGARRHDVLQTHSRDGVQLKWANNRLCHAKLTLTFGLCQTNDLHAHIIS